MLQPKFFRSYPKQPADSGLNFPHSGFTLIEILLVMIVASTLSALGFVSYSNYNSTQLLKQTALTLKNNLRLAQMDASSSKRPENCINFSGYQVSLNSHNYSIRAACDSGAGPAVTYKFPGEITLNPLPSPSTFKYQILTHGLDTASTVHITLVGQSSKSYKIDINPSGSIDDNGFQ